MPTVATTFDVNGARQAGYSDDEILQHLGQTKKFDVAGALKAGYQPQEILGHFQQKQIGDQANAAIQGIPRPALPEGLAPSGFMERAGERISQNLSYPARVAQTAMDAARGNLHGTAAYDFDLTTPEAKAAAARDLQAENAGNRQMVTGGAKTGLGMAAGILSFSPRLLYQQGKEYVQDPAMALGDIATAAPALAEGGLPRVANKQYGIAPPPPLPEGLLTIEQTAKYTNDLYKASRDYHDQSLAYNDKLNEQFDTAKREQVEGGAAYQQKVQKAQQQHAVDVADAQREFADAQAKEAASRQTWEAKSQAARESREQAAQVAAQKQQLIESQSAMAEDTRQRAQELYKAERQGLNQSWDQIREGQKDANGQIIRPGIKEAPSPVAPVVDALNKAENEYLRGSPESITRFRQLVQELGLEDITGVADDEEAATAKAGKWYQVNPEQPTAAWQTLRTHSANISRAMAGGDLGNVYPAMKLVGNALEKVAGDVATQHGWGAEYQATHAREAQFRKDFEDLGPVSLGKGNPAARLVRAPNAAYAADIIQGKASDLLEQALNRWDKSGDLATNLLQVRGMEDALRNLPKVKILPEPAPYTGKPPVMRTVPEPELPTRPSIPEKKPPTAPELAEVPKPVPEPVNNKPGFLLRHAATVGGKLVGGGVGSMVGHPFIGMGIGTEVGSELARRIVAKRTLPPVPKTPEAYQRTILAAKEGDLSPGEADRQIVRKGGSVKIKPLPPPE